MRQVSHEGERHERSRFAGIHRPSQGGRRAALVLRRRPPHLEGDGRGDRWRVPALRGPPRPRQGHAAAHPPRLRRDDDRARGRDPHAPRRRRAHGRRRRHRGRTAASRTRSRSSAPTAPGCCASTHPVAARRSTGTPASPPTTATKPAARSTWVACRRRRRRTAASRSSARRRSRSKRRRGQHERHHAVTVELPAHEARSINGDLADAGARPRLDPLDQFGRARNRTGEMDQIEIPNVAPVVRLEPPVIRQLAISAPQPAGVAAGVAP